MKIFSEKEKGNLADFAKTIIDYRRSGIGLNHIIGCPLDCIYCARHFWNNFEQVVPLAISVYINGKLNSMDGSSLESGNKLAITKSTIFDNLD